MLPLLAASAMNSLVSGAVDLFSSQTSGSQSSGQGSAASDAFSSLLPGGGGHKAHAQASAGASTSPPAAHRLLDRLA